tara:strand:+ start:192 stop:377 length:186 start_codon:yes stop_codon:yes gene_type:complete
MTVIHLTNIYQNVYCDGETLFDRRGSLNESEVTCPDCDPLTKPEGMPSQDWATSTYVVEHA